MFAQKRIHRGRAHGAFDVLYAKQDNQLFPFDHLTSKVCRQTYSVPKLGTMNLLCKLALIAIPYNLVSVALLQLDYLHHASSGQVDRNFGNATLLVVAHPDDETMFFGPLMLNLLANGKYLHILCLSQGNADKLGGQREKELESVVAALGPNASLKIINDPFHMKDGLDIRWNSGVIIRHVSEYIHVLPGIQNVVTFDSYGVSGHPNHRSLYEAMVEFKQTFSEQPTMKYFNLRSVNIFRKYITFFDSIITYPPRILTAYKWPAFFGIDDEDVVLALDFVQNKRLRKLLNLHASQMVWFRKLYMLFSRHMFLNNLIPL